MATFKTLPRAMLNNLANWSKAGDMYARAAVASINNDAAGGRASLIAISAAAPVAKGTTDVHAAFRGDAATNAVTTAFTNPTLPRNLRFVFGSTFDGGNLTVVGTDVFGKAQTEVVTTVANSTVVGVKVFKTVTSVTKAAVGTDATGNNTCSVGTGDKLGIPVQVSAPVILMTSGVTEAGTFDATNNGITPTTVPNGTATYAVLANV